MSTLTGTIKFSGTGIQTGLRFNLLTFPLARDGRIDSGGDRSLSTDADGAFSISLPGGQYRVTWFVGTTPNVGYIDLPDDGASHALDDLLRDTPQAPAESNGPIPDTAYLFNPDGSITITSGGQTTVVSVEIDGSITEVIDGRTYRTTFTPTGGSTVRIS